MNRDIILWAGRITALTLLALGLPFYFGYGNPLPFVDPEYSVLENLWLTAMPLVFIGLALGLARPRIGGWLVLGSLACAHLFSLARGEFLSAMLLPVIPGVLYVLTARTRQANKKGRLD